MHFYEKYWNVMWLQGVENGILAWVICMTINVFLWSNVIFTILKKCFENFFFHWNAHLSFPKQNIIVAYHTNLLASWICCNFWFDYDFIKFFTHTILHLHILQQSAITHPNSSRLQIDSNIEFAYFYSSTNFCAVFGILPLIFSMTIKCQ